jgi:MarR family transcriptional regulator, organic hydroperoxide resistance regulator
MTGRLKDEIKQNKPFGSLEQEVFLNLQRTADALSRRVAAALKPLGLSPTQFNVLRILRGAGNSGLPCGEIGERMVTRDPDITRLLDRMEKSGLIERHRESNDRRVITARISKEGLRLLAEFDAQDSKLERQMLGHMDERKLKALRKLLEEARNGSK